MFAKVLLKKVKMLVTFSMVVSNLDIYVKGQGETVVIRELPGKINPAVNACFSHSVAGSLPDSPHTGMMQRLIRTLVEFSGQ